MVEAAPTRMTGLRAVLITISLDGLIAGTLFFWISQTPTFKLSDGQGERDREMTGTIIEIKIKPIDRCTPMHGSACRRIHACDSTFPSDRLLIVRILCLGGVPKRQKHIKKPVERIFGSRADATNDRRSHGRRRDRSDRTRK